MLMSAICSENPHFIDNISNTSTATLSLIFDLLRTPLTTPYKDDALITVLNFLHNISLKEGPIRNDRLSEVLTTLLENILTHDRFS
jgi:hypothetical protein